MVIKCTGYHRDHLWRYAGTFFFLFCRLHEVVRGRVQLQPAAGPLCDAHRQPQAVAGDLSCHKTQHLSITKYTLPACRM